MTEGLRRLGLVLGVLGLCAGMLVSYVELKGVLEQRVQYQEQHPFVGKILSLDQLDALAAMPQVANPKFSAYIFPALFPPLGFLIPWGAIRALSWVLSGFRPSH